eukprot:1260482-Amphidinium_carterae.1
MVNSDYLNLSAFVCPQESARGSGLVAKKFSTSSGPKISVHSTDNDTSPSHNKWASGLTL